MVAISLLRDNSLPEGLLPGISALLGFEAALSFQIQTGTLVLWILDLLVTSVIAWANSL